MTIRFTCAECSSVMKIKVELAGTSARCPKCKTPFVVPESSGEMSLSSHEMPVQLPLSSDQTSGEVHSPHIEGKVKSSADETGHPLETPVSTGDTAEFKSATMDSTDTQPASGADSSRGEESKSKRGGNASRGTSDDVYHLQSEDEGDEHVAAAAVAPKESEQPSPVAVGMTSTVENEDELDCPSMFVFTYGTPIKAEQETIEPRRFGMTRVTSDFAPEFTAHSPTMPKPTRQQEPIDPMKFLSDNKVGDEEKKGIPARSPVPFSVPPGSDADLSLSDESDFDIPSNPTPQPMSRRTPLAPSSRPAPEKVDLATAAKMMKKAIKDSQADANRQRDLDARPGYDYMLFFREFGTRGLGILLVAVIGPAILYFAFDYMLTSRLKLPKLGYVSGTIKVDGKPVSGLMVYFAPTDINVPGGKRDRARTSVGISDESGHFKMMYTENIEGVTAGKCRIWLSATSGDKMALIPSDWMELSMRTTEVAIGSQKAPFDINIELKKK